MVDPTTWARNTGDLTSWQRTQGERGRCSESGLVARPCRGHCTGMDLDDLARHVGPDLFTRACRTATATAPGTGGDHPSRPHPESASRDDEAEADVPHELATLVEGDLDLAIALYRVMPCYANLMYLEGWAPGPELYDHLRRLLDDPDDALADPAAYWLWCGPFEADDTTAATAWEALTIGPTDRRLARLLAVSGPVPWPAKNPTFEALVALPRWTPALREALDHAEADHFGRTDRTAAARIRDQLRLLDG